MTSGQLPEGSLLNGRYRIMRAIGEGGMGTVYQAEHERLNAIVAVKEIKGPSAAGEITHATLEQYEREARFLVRLNHPNLPKVTDAFIEDDRFYLVMEYIEGITLERRLKDSGGLPLDIHSVVEWGLQIADVLAYLHSQDPPIIFRDLKPSNVMLQPNGQIRLIDFGIARRFQPGANKDTALLGSVGYSPPEQFGRHQTDTRSDIYAFGATLHHLVTGRDPAATPFKFVLASILNPAVPQSLAKLLARCLAIDADSRPSSIHEVAMSLLAIRDEMAAHDQAVKAASEAPPPRIVSAKLSEATRGRSGQISSPTGRHAPTGPQPSAGVPAGTRALMATAAVLGVVAVLAAGLVAVRARQRQQSPAISTVRPPASMDNVGTAPPPNPDPPMGTGPTGPVGPEASPTTGPGSTIPGADNHGLTSPPIKSPSATCKLEPALSTDGQLLRLHVSGLIIGKKGDQCHVVAQFFDGDRPIMAKTQGPYMMPDGTLAGTYAVDCLGDSHSYDGIIEVPRSEIGEPTNQLIVQYSVVSHDQRLMEPQTMSLAKLIPASESPRPNGPGRSGGSIIVPGGP